MAFEDASCDSGDTRRAVGVDEYRNAVGLLVVGAGWGLFPKV